MVRRIRAACQDVSDLEEWLSNDQKTQFTGAAWIITLTEADVKISMDGRGRYLDNAFTERHWRSLKHEAAYLHELQDAGFAKSPQTW